MIRITEPIRNKLRELIIPESLFQDTYNVITDLGEIENDERTHFKLHLIDIADISDKEEKLAVDIRLWDLNEEYCGPGIQLTPEQIDEFFYLVSDILPDYPAESEYSSMEEVEGEG